jgi:predicted nuclease of predicted toxin-antitoxin system
MRILLDENLPHGLRQQLPGHKVFTVAYMGWRGLENGDLLEQAAAAGIDVLLTLDVGFRYQQSVSELPVSIIIIRASSNDLSDLNPIVPRLLRLLDMLRPKTLVILE